MNAKNGELAIARFDDGTGNQKICFVIGRDKSQTKFVYWEHKSNGTIMCAGELPKSRVVKAIPKPGQELVFLSGEFYKLTINDVVPATPKNIDSLCLSVAVDTSKVKLGGCYHTGKAYCLGYRNSCDGEVELGAEVFTCLDSGVDGGAVEELRKHKEDFNPLEDIPHFIVELAAVRIIDEDTNVDAHVGPDVCDECLKSVENCDCDFEDAHWAEDDCECGNHSDDCGCEDYDDCLDDDECYVCGVVECICIEDDDDFDDDGYCNLCGEICTDCECADDDLDDENVDQTFRPMNAFARARWLKACSR